MTDLAGAKSVSPVGAEWVRKRTTTASPRSAPPGHAPQSTKPARPWHVGYRRRALLSDAATALVTAAAVIVLPVGGAPASVRWGVALLLPGVWILMLQLFHGYEQRFLGITTDEYRSVARAALSLGVAAVLSSWLLHFELARGLVLIVVPMLMRPRARLPQPAAPFSAPAPHQRARHPAHRRHRQRPHGRPDDPPAPAGSGRGHARRRRLRLRHHQRRRLLLRGRGHPGLRLPGGGAARHRPPQRRGRGGVGGPRPERSGPAPPRLVTRGACRRPRGRDRPARRRRTAALHPPRSGDAAAPRRAAGHVRRPPRGEAGRRLVPRPRPDDRCPSGPGGHRHRDPPRLPGSRAVPSDAGRGPGRDLQHAQVPQHGRRRRAAAGPAGRRRRRRQHGAVQDAPRPADHPGRRVPAPLLARRAAAAGQRPARRDVAGRPPAAAAATRSPATSPTPCGASGSARA